MCHHPGMGRHARGAARLRVSVSAVVLGTLIVTVVAVGSLLSSQAQPTPIAAQGVEGTAVVVSSLACPDGGGGTLVDVLSPAGLPVGATVRASLDGCGYQEGEQLVVQYAASDPTRVTLLSEPAGGTATGDRLLPVGLMLAALLVVAAAAAVWVDARRGRRARALRPLVNDRGTSSEFGSTLVGASENRWPAQAFGAPDGTMRLFAGEPGGSTESHRPAGRHARPEADRAEPSRAENDGAENDGAENDGAENHGAETAPATATSTEEPATPTPLVISA